MYVTESYPEFFVIMFYRTWLVDIYGLFPMDRSLDSVSYAQIIGLDRDQLSLQVEFKQAIDRDPNILSCNQDNCAL